MACNGCNLSPIVQRDILGISGAPTWLRTLGSLAMLAPSGISALALAPWSPALLRGLRLPLARAAGGAEVSAAPQRGQAAAGSRRHDSCGARPRRTRAGPGRRRGRGAGHADCQRRTAAGPGDARPRQRHAAARPDRRAHAHRLALRAGRQVSGAQRDRDRERGRAIAANARATLLAGFTTDSERRQSRATRRCAMRSPPASSTVRAS